MNHQEQQDRRHTAVLLLCQMMDALDPLGESTMAEARVQNQILVDKAIAITDLLFQRLKESSHNNQLKINHPKYQKGERVILTCSDQQSIQVVKDVFFDHNQDEWLYKFELSNLIIHEFYSESFLSKALA